MHMEMWRWGDWAPIERVYFLLFPRPWTSSSTSHQNLLPPSLLGDLTLLTLTTLAFRTAAHRSISYLPIRCISDTSGGRVNSNSKKK
jgi:hypothetical protein